MGWRTPFPGGGRQVVDLFARAPSVPRALAFRLAQLSWIVALIGGVLIILQGIDIVVAVHAFRVSCPGASIGCTGQIQPGRADVVGGAAIAYGLVYLSAARYLRDRRLVGWHRVLVGTWLQLVGVAATLVMAPSLAVPIGVLEVVVVWYALAQVRPYFAG